MWFATTPGTSSQNQLGETDVALRAAAISGSPPIPQHQTHSQKTACFGSTSVRVANLNVLSLSDSPNNVGRAELLLHQLAKLRVVLCGLSEVRWPGKGVRHIAGYTVLHSGRADNLAFQGVAIAITSSLWSTCLDWNAVNERIITATFPTSTTPLTVIQVYAPTNDAIDAVKDAFYAELQTQLDDVPHSHTLIFMGDFNAQLGNDAEQWGGSIGRFGLPSQVTNNGQRLLDLCTSNGLVVTDTMFQHRQVHLQTWISRDTWQTKNQIDHTLVRRRDFAYIQDTRVFRGADVQGSDHRLQISKLKLKFRKSASRKARPRFQAAPLSTEEGRAAYHALFQQQPMGQHSAEAAELKWQDFKAACLATAQQLLPPLRRPVKPWITYATLQLSEVKAQAYQRTLDPNPGPAAKAEYNRLKLATSASAAADWQCFQNSTMEQLQTSMRKGDTHDAYKVIKQLRKPSSQPAQRLKDKQGRYLRTPQQRSQRWAQYFAELFQAKNCISPAVLSHLPPQPAGQFACPEPTLQEVVTAIKRLKNNKSPGGCSILPEMLKYGGDAVHSALYDVILAAWRSESAPADFKQDVVVPIPKKGDSTDCSAYRTIVLQSMAGKAYAQLIRARLKDWLQQQLLEPQYGFRPDRSCSDALFSLRLLCERAWDKQQTLFLGMLDLTKAFDSVDRSLAWQILLRRGAPTKLVALIRDLHTGHSAVIRGEVDSRPVASAAGFKQGCVLAPDLFSLYLDTAVRSLQPVLRSLGVRISYKIDGQLSECKHPTHDELVWILMYADDICLIADNPDDLEQAIVAMDAAFLTYGLTVSTHKTKILVVGKDAETYGSNLHILVRDTELEVVTEFQYLGSIFSADNSIDRELSNRITKAGYAWHSLKVAKVWSSSKLSLYTKLQFFTCIVLSILLYGCETWTIIDRHVSRLRVFQLKCLRGICGISLLSHITNEAVLKRCDMVYVDKEIQYRRLRWLGHVGRMADDRLPKRLLFSQVSGQRPVGRPRLMWNDLARADLISVRENRWYRKCQSRVGWKDLIAAART